MLMILSYPPCNGGIEDLKYNFKDMLMILSYPPCNGGIEDLKYNF